MNLAPAERGLFLGLLGHRLDGVLPLAQSALAQTGGLGVGHVGGVAAVVVVVRVLLKEQGDVTVDNIWDI